MSLYQQGTPVSPEGVAHNRLLVYAKAVSKSWDKSIVMKGTLPKYDAHPRYFLIDSKGGGWGKGDGGRMNTFVDSV